MKHFLTLSAFILGFAIAAPQAYANKLSPYYETLKQFNRIDPLQNPSWENATSTMKSTVQDSKNKVVGVIDDILVSPNGRILSLNVDLNRLQLGKMNLNYTDMRIQASSRSYALALNDREIKDVMPELLASMETASGDDSDVISINNLKGSSIQVDDGRRIGSVENIMFDKSGSHVTALVLKINYKTTRNKMVAIPFNSVNYVATGNRYVINMNAVQADTIIEYANGV